MPVPVLVGQILAITANWFFAFLTGVGVKTFITLHAVGTLFSQDVLLAKQGLLAVVTVKAFSHFGV